jgi:hypothetical protein
MVWQDIAITLINVLTGYVLIPQVYHGFKTKTSGLKLQTLIITTICLFSFAIVFATMGLILSALISTFNSIMWGLLLLQKLKYSNNTKP